MTTRSHLSVQTLAPGSQGRPKLLSGISFPSDLFGFLRSYVANFLSFQSSLLHLKSEGILFIASEFEGEEITEVRSPFNIENKGAKWCVVV